MVKADVSITDECRQLVSKTIENYGRLDILVNNAGIGLPSFLLAKDYIETFDSVHSANLRSAAVLIHLVAKHLVASKGVVINMSSVLGSRPELGCSNYNIAKAGMDMLTKSAAIELGPHGVRVVGVAPAVINTPIWATSLPNIAKGSENPAYDLARQSYPLRREDVTSVVLFLASDQASYVTGQTLAIDGGFLQTSCGMIPK